METIMKLLRQPLIKIIAVFLILYFGLLSNKKDPDGLGNRLSSQNLKQDFQEVKEKSNFIITNIQRAKDLNGGKASTAFDPTQDFVQIGVKDVQIGNGEVLKCGDLAEVSYDIRVVGSPNQLEFIPKEKILIGSNKNLLLEKKIVGMKKGGSRVLNIPRDFKSTNQKLEFLLKFNSTDLQYNVTLLDFTRAEPNSVVDCLK